jgi:hypothetical protein
MTATVLPEVTLTGAEAYAEREKRFNDAVALKQPDRVPTFVIQELFPARYAGISLKEAFYDLDKWLDANEKTVVDFQPDMYFFLAAGVGAPGRVWETLGYRQHKWPGFNLGADVPFQFVEEEYMKADEYDHFLDDPSDYLIRVYLPRTNSALAGLGMLPPLKSLIMGAAGFTPLLLAPPVAAAFAALNQAAPLAAQWSAGEAAFYQKMAGMGYPCLGNAVTLAPFDLISDFMRGLRGIMLDMYRCPEKLQVAQEKVLPLMLGSAIGMAQMSGNPRIFIPLHRGADGFMSIKQFEKFYWPYLKALMLGLIDAGLTPVPFYEGMYDQRLQYMRELPPGKVVAWFDRTDLFRAKKIIGDHTCIAGGMQVSLLQSGTIEQVRDLTRQLVKEVGAGGGYIMTSSTALDDTKPELVKAWLDATLEYGTY